MVYDNPYGIESLDAYIDENKAAHYTPINRPKLTTIVPFGLYHLTEEAAKAQIRDILNSKIHGLIEERQRVLSHAEDLWEEKQNLILIREGLK